KERVLLIRTADGSLLGYDIAQNVKVVMEGRVNPDLEDLEISDQVQLSINESNDGKVEKIEIMNRSIMTVARAELVTFVPQTKSFVVILPGEEKSSIFHMN